MATPSALRTKSQRVGTRTGAPKRIEAIVVSAAFALALGLRLWRLDAQSLWYDEGWSVHLARIPLRNAVSLMISEGDTHPPGYYVLLRLWTLLFGGHVTSWRGFSALLGALSVPALYMLGRRLFDGWSGVIAALLLAVAPAHIVYSREARMYPLLLLLLLLMGLMWLYHDLGDVSDKGQGSQWDWKRWLLLVALQTLAVYTHYFAFLALVPLAAWLLVRLFVAWRSGGRRRSEAWRRCLRWALSQVLVGIAFSPWFDIAFRRATTHVPWNAQPPAIGRFLVDTWTFLLGGHIALQGRESLYAQLALASLVASGALVVAILAVATKRLATLYLTFQGAGTVLLVFAMMRLRPGYHPRYLLTALVPTLLLLARGLHLVWPWRPAARRIPVGKIVSVGAALLWLTTSATAAQALLSDPYYVRDEARGTASYLDAELPQGGMVWVDHVDWALPYYFERTSLQYIAFDIGRYDKDPIDEVVNLLAGQTRLALVRWHQGTADHRGLLAYVLERRGTLVHREYISGYQALVYEIDPTPLPEVAGRADASFGALRLAGSRVDAQTPADEAVAVALDWRVDSAPAHDLKVVLELMDGKGRVIARGDAALMDALGARTSRWPVGNETTTYHMLQLAPDIAPLAYMLRVGLYHEADFAGLDLMDQAGAPAGKRLVLGTIQLTPPQGRSETRPRREALGLAALPQAVELAPGLALRAQALSDRAIATGEKLTAALEWASASDQPLPDYTIEMALVRGSNPLAQQASRPVDGRYPTDRWAPGQTVVEWRELSVPLDIESGKAEVRLRVIGGGEINLGAIEVQHVPHSYDAPQAQERVQMPIGDLATLVGYDLRHTRVAPGQPLSLTLHWRAHTASQTPLTVFVHVLDQDGNLVAQHDSPPANGGRPTTGWLQDEYISDDHTIQWVGAAAPGRAAIEVGFYDPQSGVRLLTPQQESRLLLPGVLIID